MDRAGATVDAGAGAAPAASPPSSPAVAAGRCGTRSSTRRLPEPEPHLADGAMVTAPFLRGAARRASHRGARQTRCTDGVIGICSGPLSPSPQAPEPERSGRSTQTPWSVQQQEDPDRGGEREGDRRPEHDERAQASWLRRPTVLVHARHPRTSHRALPAMRSRLRPDDERFAAREPPEAVGRCCGIRCEEGRGARSNPRMSRRPRRRSHPRRSRARGAGRSGRWSARASAP